MNSGISTTAPAPEAHEIREQCQRLCDSRAFKASERLRKLLQHLVERTLEQRQRSLGQRQLAVEVFGRNERFDPERDAIVRIEMGKLRQALELYYGETGQQDPVRIAIPRGTYVPEFQPGPEPAATPTAQAVPPARPTGIAVLPFDTLAKEQGTQWLAEGLREELSLILTHIPELAVASHHALKPFTVASADLNAIGRELGVRFFLDGSVQRAGNRVRVSARLYDGKQRRKVWSGRYDRDLSTADLLDIQDDVARQVVAQAVDLYSGVVGRSLRSELGADATSDIQVYEAILRFHQYLHELSDQSYTAARRSLERAICIEPDNPLLLSKLGDARRAGYCLGFTDEPDPSADVLEMQQRAVSLDPECLPCQVSLGFILLKLRRHQALQELIAANLSNTGAPTSHRADMAMLAALSGDWERGCRLLHQELIDTRGHPAVFLLPLVLDAYRRGDYRGALDLAGKLKPTPLFWLPMLKAACQGRRGDTGAAAKELESLLTLRPNFTSLGRRYLSCFLAEDQLVDDILQGLRLAGLEIN